MSINTLLSHVKKVKKSGQNSWMACCPSHDDRSASLKITLADDKVLINCFAGCIPVDILGAVGLTMDDLFETPREHSSKGIRGTNVYPREVLKAMLFEMMIVAISSFDMKKGKTLSDIDQARLILAYERITHGIELAGIE